MAFLYLQKRDKTYYLIDTAKQNKWVKLGPDRTKAKRIVDAYNAGADLLEIIEKLEVLPKAKVTFAELREEYAETLSYRGAKEKQVQTNSLARFSFLDDKYLYEIKTSDLQDFLDRQDWTGGTAKRYFHALKMAFKYAISNDLLRKNPVEGISYPPLSRSVPRYLTEPEINKLFKELSPENQMICQIMRYTGLRPKECLSLRVEDIDLKTHQIIIRKAKTGKDQGLYFSKKLLPMFKPYLKGRQGYLFPSSRVEGPKRSIYTSMVRAAVRAKIKATPYQLRHTFATRLLKTVDLKGVQQALRHTNISTTSRYSWVLGKDLKRGIDKV